MGKQSCLCYSKQAQTHTHSNVKAFRPYKCYWRASCSIRQYIHNAIAHQKSNTHAIRTKFSLLRFTFCGTYTNLRIVIHFYTRLYTYSMCAYELSCCVVRSAMRQAIIFCLAALKRDNRFACYVVRHAYIHIKYNIKKNIYNLSQKI